MYCFLNSETLWPQREENHITILETAHLNAVNSFTWGLFYFFVITTDSSEIKISHYQGYLSSCVFKYKKVSGPSLIHRHVFRRCTNCWCIKQSIAHCNKYHTRNAVFWQSTEDLRAVVWHQESVVRHSFTVWDKSALPRVLRTILSVLKWDQAITEIRHQAALSEDGAIFHQIIKLLNYWSWHLFLVSLRDIDWWHVIYFLFFLGFIFVLKPPLL